MERVVDCRGKRRETAEGREREREKEGRREEKMNMNMILRSQTPG